MPLLLNCSCGKRFRVPDEKAGQRFRCPGCECALTVPSAPEPEAPEPAPEAIRFDCVCGRPLRVKGEYAGRLTRCPACRTQLTVPDAEGDGTPLGKAHIRPDRPRPARPARAEDERPRHREEEEEDRPRHRDEEQDERPSRRDPDDRVRRRDEDEPAPRPKRKARRSSAKRSVLPWVLAGSGALLLLIAGGAIAGWLLYPRAASDMAFVPPDAQGFVSVRLADLWKVDSVQKSLKQAREMPGGMGDPSAEMEKATGLRPEEVERVTVVFKDVEKEHVWIVVSTTKAYDRKKILGKMTSSREAKHEGKTYHVGAMGGGPSGQGGFGAPPGPGGFGGPPPGPGGFGGAPGPQAQTQTALYFASSRVLVFGPEEGVKQCLTFAAGKKTAGPLSDTIKRAGGKHHLVGGFNLQAGQGQKVKGAMGQVLGKYESLFDIQSGSVVMDFGDTTTIEASVRYPSEGQASQAKKTIDEGLAELEKLRLKLEEEARQPGAPPEAKNYVEAFQEIRKGFSIQQKGADLTLRLSVRNKTLDGIMPQNPAGPPPGFPKR